MSTVVRPYTTHITIVVLSLWFLIRWMEDKRGRDLWAYSGLIAAGLLTHYSTFQILGGIGLSLSVALITKQIPRSELRRLALAHLPVAATTAVLYITHIGPRLMGSALQEEAQTTWLKTFLEPGLGHLWRNYLGVFDYLMTANAHGVSTLQRELEGAQVEQEPREITGDSVGDRAGDGLRSLVHGRRQSVLHQADERG